jgi:hypothetical protein
MIDSVHGGRLTIDIGEGGYSNLIVPVSQLDQVKSLFDAHQLVYWIAEEYLSVDDEPEVAFISFSLNADKKFAQQLLDGADDIKTNSAESAMMLNPQITGNIGLYYCCYCLSLRGWNVMPTARNARGVDIIAYNRDAAKYIGIQVKALSKRNPVPLGTSLDKIMGDFWVIINKVASPSRAAFILLPSEVRERAHRGEKDGRISYWLQPPGYDQDQFREAWERIGYG